MGDVHGMRNTLYFLESFISDFFPLGVKLGCKIYQVLL